MLPYFVTASKRTAILLPVFVMVALGLSASRAAGGTFHLATNNPSQNCDQGQIDYLHLTIWNINRCRRLENVGPVHLPSNYHRLKPAKRLFVLMNLARINRGMRPIVGMSRPLNAFARRGARAQTDPPFPRRGYGGAVQTFASSVAAAQWGWMYDDGWSTAATTTNVACTSPNAVGCWMHRDIILMSSRQRLVAGGAVHPVNEPGKIGHSYAFLVLSGYSRRHLTFRWRRELKYFKVRPRRERLSSG